MAFFAVYDAASHDLLLTSPDAPAQADVPDGYEVKQFSGAVDGLTWNPEALDFAPTPSEPVDVPPDTSQQIADLQAQIDTLTTAWLEG